MRKMVKIAVVMMAMALGSAVSVQAAIRTWAGNTDTNLATGANWDTPFSVGDAMMFGVAGSSGTNLYNNLGAGTSVSGITFNANSSGYVLNGNAITLEGTVTNFSTVPQVINMNMTLTTNWNIVCISNNITLGGVFSGPGGLIKGKNFDLTLIGTNNTYTGPTKINAGKLIITSLNSVNGGTPLFASSSLGAPATVVNGTILFGTAATTGTLVYAGTGETTDRMMDLLGSSGEIVVDQSGTGLLKFTGGVTSIAGGSKTLIFQGSTAGTGEMAGAINVNGILDVIKRGTGSWTLSGSNNYSGNITIDGGTLQFGNGVTGYSLPTGAITNNGLLVVNQSGSNALTGAISGSGSLIKAGSGTLALAGSNTYSGTIIVSNGVLKVGSAAGAAVVVTNFGFEYPVTNSCYGTNMPGDAGWLFTNAAGIVSNNYAGFFNTAPEGTQAGYLQGGSGYFSQTITIATAAMYEVSFQAIGRQILGPNGLILKADGNQIASWTNGVFSQASWGTYTGRVFLTDGPHTLTFVGWDTIGGDKSTSIDNVSVVSAPMNLNTLSANSKLYLTSGSWLDIGGDTQTVSMLYLDGHMQYSGTYGALGSGARFVNANYFTGSGILYVNDGAVHGIVITLR